MKPYTITVFIRHFGWGIYLPLAVIVPLQRGLNLTQIGFITAAVLLASLLVEIPTGFFADRFGRTRSIIAGSILHVFGALLFAFSGDFFSFLIAEIVMGSGWSLISGADEAYMYELLKERGEEATYKKFLSRISLADEIGTLIGFLTSSLLVWRFGERSALIATALLLAVSTLYAWVTLSEPVRFTDDVTTKPNESGAVGNALRFAKEHIYFLSLALFLAFLYESGRMLWQPQLLHLGFTAGQIGIVYAVLGLFSIAGASAAGHRRIKASVSTLVLLGCLQIVSFLLFSFNGTVVSLLGIGLYLFIEKISRVAQSEVISTRVASQYRATFLSVKNLARSGGGAVFALLLGADASHVLRYGFYTLIGINAVGLVGLCFVVLIGKKLESALKTAEVSN